MQTFLDKHNNNEDRIKKFNILWNAARCFNAMQSSELAKKLLDLAEKLLEPEDTTQHSLLNVELANYYISKKQIKFVVECYQKALYFSSNEEEKWSRAYPLYRYAHWLYVQGQYAEALAKYKQLEGLLQNTEFRSMQADNYYHLALTILKVTPQQQQEAENYREQARQISTELGLVLAN
ncbi:MAG: hypothetical protein AB4290_18035 [Spirulina sp.]